MTLDVRLWPSVGYLERKLLPAVSGVYAAVDNTGSLLYIGMSQSIRGRWYSHPLKRQISAPEVIRIHYQITSDTESALELERHLILALNPPMNKQHSLKQQPGSNGKIMMNFRARSRLLKKIQKAATLLGISVSALIIDAVNEKIRRESRRDDYFKNEIEKVEA